uniref:Uncharacterized protein n=1 Tax=Amphimedon queenslandica TaxID=400682 RepID=A0A1X7T644_AMPQE
MDGPGVFKWITFQEILFLFISCSVLAFLLRSQDSLEFKLVLNVTTEERAARENYANQKFPLRNEKLPLPIVTDLESDGQTDVILVSADKVLNVYSRHYTPSYLGHHGIKHSNKNVSLLKMSRVVAMTTGFLQPYQSVVQVRKQVIAVLYSDWTLSCYNHNLKLMWSKKLNENEIPISSEASLLVSAISIKKSPAGVILVGGRINGNYDNNNNNDNIGGDSDKRRMRRGAEQEKIEHQKNFNLNTCTFTLKWIPKLNQYKRKKVNHGNTEPFTPLLIESPSHQHPLKVSTLRRNSSFSLPVGVAYDSIFLLSSGRVTSIGPRGQFNWQTDTEADWDFATDTIYSNNESPVGGAEGGGDKKRKMEYDFVSESFRPSMSALALKSYGKKDHILLIGWYSVTVLDATDGSILVQHILSSPPLSKPVISDFTDDSSNDIIIQTQHGLIGLSLVHRSGFLHSTILSLFIGFIIVLVAVYTRQRTGFLMPKIKEAQD